MTAPLMPKATAVWLVENTTLTFRQISDFCELHELEIQAIADGDVSGNIAENGNSTRDGYKRKWLKWEGPLNLMELILSRLKSLF